MNVILSPWYVILACLSGWLNREQQKLIEYLQSEVKSVRENPRGWSIRPSAN